MTRCRIALPRLVVYATQPILATFGHPMPIRVLITDDHSMLRDALSSALEREHDIEIVGEAGNGVEALRLAMEKRPDVTLMDISMPGLDGINATRRLVKSMPDAKVLGLSTHADRHFVSQMLAAGAKGYIVKTCGLVEMVKAIRAVAEDRTYLCQQAANAVAESVRGNNGSGATTLGRREIQVLSLLAAGKTSQQIGEKLHITHGTVDVHRRNIMRKLGLHRVAELTLYAIRAGLVSL